MKKALAFLLTALGFSATAPGTDAQTAAGFKYSVQSQLVEVYLTVTQDKQRVPNLKASDFKLTEDGLPVAIDRLDSHDVPLQVVLLCDLSESISGSLKYIQDAATAFIESLSPEDRATLVMFNSEIRLVAQSTGDREPLLNEIRNARARGTTRLYEALLVGMKYLDGKPGRKALVCFTDGEDTSGTFSRIAVRNAAARSGYPIYTIGAGAGLELESLKMILSDFAEINSGRALFLQNLHKLREAFAEVLAELKSAYVIRYYTLVPRDGRWHELSVRAAEPAYEVRARKGFFAGSPAD